MCIYIKKESKWESRCFFIYGDNRWDSDRKEPGEKTTHSKKRGPELDDSRSELGRRKSRRMKDGKKAWIISNKVHIHFLVLNKRYPHCIAFPLLLHLCDPSGKRPSLKMAIISSQTSRNVLSQEKCIIHSRIHMSQYPSPTLLYSPSSYCSSTTTPSKRDRRAHM